MPSESSPHRSVESEHQLLAQGRVDGTRSGGRTTSWWRLTSSSKQALESAGDIQHVEESDRQCSSERSVTHRQTDLPISFAGGTLDRYRHVCAFFDSFDDELRVLGPFVREGLERGERAFHIVDPAVPETYRARLAGAGIPVRPAEARGQFQIISWDDAYLRDGHFDQNRMLALIEDVLQAGPRDGFPLTRLVAHMEWSLEDRPGVNDLVEYETRLNYVLPKYKDPVI